MLSELRDFTPRPIPIIEIKQTGGGIELADITPPLIPLIEVEQSGDDDIERSPPPPAITLPYFSLV
jgi:hypothetical protein